MIELSEWSMPLEAFDYLATRLSPDATVVECGSGAGTELLVAYFDRVVSIEHNPEYVGMVDGATYVHAPLRGGWYDVDEVRRGLPENYDCVIVDGPPGSSRRLRFRHDMFRRDVPMLIDDVHRPAEHDMAFWLAHDRHAYMSVHYLKSGRAFATIGWVP